MNNQNEGKDILPQTDTSPNSESSVSEGDNGKTPQADTSPNSESSVSEGDNGKTPQADTSPNSESSVSEGDNGKTPQADTSPNSESSVSEGDNGKTPQADTSPNSESSVSEGDNGKTPQADTSPNSKRSVGEGDNGKTPQADTSPNSESSVSEGDNGKTPQADKSHDGKSEKNNSDDIMREHTAQLQECIANLKEIANTNQNDVGQIFLKIKEMEDLRSHYSGLRNAYSDLQKNLGKKDAEIERLKDGYDTKIFRKFLRRFVNIDRKVKRFMADDKASKNDALEYIRKLFEDALDECGVETFSPSIEGDYKSAFGVAPHPEIEATDDEKKHHKISEVLNDGYSIPSEEGEKPYVIEPAEVKIFKHNKKEK